ncbi:MAG: hypothetical protein AB1352_01105 [Patescibacteria group bacterium]
MAKLKPMKVQQTLLEQDLRVFSIHEFMRAFDVSLRAAEEYLKNHSKKEGDLFLRLKNGLYALATRLPSEYFIANKLVQPSYVSLETVMARHSIIPEIVYTITSVTTKTPREFVTRWLAFSYTQIKRSAFTGYSPVQERGFTVFIADPEKALVDYLYIVDLKKKGLNDRLNLLNVSRRKVESYARLFGRRSLMKLIDHVYAESRKPREIY